MYACFIFIFVLSKNSVVLKPFDIDVINQFREELLNVDKHICIIPHINPDGDAIGSVLGLAGVLKNMGKSVKVISPNEYPDFLNWMTGHDEVIVYTKQKEHATQLMESAGMLICLDFNHLSRAGEMKGLVKDFKGVSFLIDHHPNPESFTNWIISHPECSSTAELVFTVLKACEFDKHIDKDAAEAFFCGVMTDTGSFHYNVSDPQTFQTVSELLAFGIDQEKVHGLVYDNYSEHRMRLMGYCLNECMEVYPEYHAAMMYLSKEVQEKFNFVTGDNESFVNLPLSIKGIHFSAFFTEKDGHVKVSLRSKGEFAVNEFARDHFNGGGHRNAAGGEVSASLKETLEKYRGLLPGYLEKLKETKI